MARLRLDQRMDGGGAALSRVELRLRPQECLHLGEYSVRSQFGFMSARRPTWLPFDVPVCLNGREWAALQLRRRRSDFERADNCFTWLGHVELAPRLADEPLQTAWPAGRDAVARRLAPLHTEILQAQPVD